jgi:hypothetical protein
MFPVWLIFVLSAVGFAGFVSSWAGGLFGFLHVRDEVDDSDYKTITTIIASTLIVNVFAETVVLLSLILHKCLHRNMDSLLVRAWMSLGVFVECLAPLVVGGGFALLLPLYIHLDEDTVDDVSDIEWFYALVWIATGVRVLQSLLIIPNLVLCR